MKLKVLQVLVDKALYPSFTEETRDLILAAMANYQPLLQKLESDKPHTYATDVIDEEKEGKNA